MCTSGFGHTTCSRRVNTPLYTVLKIRCGSGDLTPCLPDVQLGYSFGSAILTSAGYQFAGVAVGFEGLSVLGSLASLGPCVHWLCLHGNLQTHCAW